MGVVTYEKTWSTGSLWGVVGDPLVQNENDQIAEYAHQEDHLRNKLAEDVDRVLEVSTENQVQNII